MPRVPARGLPESVPPVQGPASPSPAAPPRKKQGLPGQLRTLNRKRHAEKLVLARQVWDLRYRGADYEQIREQLGLRSLKAVSKLYSWYIKRLEAVAPTEDARAWRPNLNAALNERERRLRRALEGTKRRDPESGEEVVTRPSVETVLKIETAIGRVHDQRVELNGLKVAVDQRVLVENGLREFVDFVRGYLGEQKAEELLNAFAAR